MMPGAPPSPDPAGPGRPRRGPSATRRARERERAFASRFDLFRRLYRWLNLTLVQQGVWPLLVVMAAAPALPVALTPLPWWLARTAAPALAALLAWLYLRQPPAAASADGDPPGSAAVPEAVGPPGNGFGAARRPAAWILPGLAVMLAVARVAAGPAEPAAKLIAFGIADVAAFQLVHFGVVRRSWPDEQAGTIAAVGLFAASWGLRDLFLGAVTAGALDPWLTFFGGAAVGFGIALLSWAMRRWLGGFWPAAAAHLILVYLVLGFV